VNGIHFANKVPAAYVQLSEGTVVIGSRNGVLDNRTAEE
jgi:hypothetical protein